MSNPSRLPVFWLRAADLAPLGVGASIASWTDVFGRVFTQATPSKQPTLQRTTNGFWTVRFAGGQSLDNTDAAIANLKVTNAYVEAAATAAAGSVGVMICSPATMSAQTSYCWGLARGSDDSVKGYATSTSTATIRSAAGSLGQAGWAGMNLYELSNWDPDGYIARKNGIPVVTGTPGNNGATGAGVRIGADGAGAQAFTGDITEIAVFGFTQTNNVSPAQTVTDQRLTRNYFQQKYAGV